MNFLVYDHNCEECGRVNLSNKVYDSDGYGKLLNDRNMKYLALDRETHLNPANIMVTKSLEIRKREEMPIRLSSKVIKAGAGRCIMVGIPKGAKVEMFLGQDLLGGDIVNSGAIDFGIPVPCVYRIAVTKWPWIPFSAEVEAVS